LIDYDRLMTILSVPRPNGSQAEAETCQSLCAWLAEQEIPHRIHSFRLYPFYFEAIGIWVILSRTLLAIAIWYRWSWPTLLIAIIGVLGGTLDVALGLPLVSWPGSCTGENILVEFGPSQPRQEVVISAHYDSKTELLDHRQRMFFLKNIRFGVILTLILGFLGPLDHYLLLQNSNLAAITFGTGIAATILLLFLSWGLGLNLSTGRFLKPSHGAVDDGAACAILLGLAKHLAAGEVPLRHTRVMLALFSGEEVNLQGSRAYVSSRDWPLPCAAVNLEVMSQDGDYVLWDKDGSVFKLSPTSSNINHAVSEAVYNMTMRRPRPGGPIISDGASFLAAGIPTAVLGTYDQVWKDTGFHRPSDCLDRVIFERLPEGVAILKRFLEKQDNIPAQSQLINCRQS
jgi:hypothetical protein